MVTANPAKTFCMACSVTVFIPSSCSLIPSKTWTELSLEVSGLARALPRHRVLLRPVVVLVEQRQVLTAHAEQRLVRRPPLRGTPLGGYADHIDGQLQEEGQCDCGEGSTFQ